MALSSIALADLDLDGRVELIGVDLEGTLHAFDEHFNYMNGFPLNVKSGQKVDAERLRDLFQKNDIYDYLDYKPSGGILTLTRNPFGFASKLRKGKDKKIVNKGVQSSEKGVVSDAEFQKKMSSLALGLGL